MKRDKSKEKLAADLNHFAERIERTFADDYLFRSLLNNNIKMENGVLFYKGVDFRQLHLVFKEDEINEVMKELNKILSRYLDLKLNYIKDNAEV